MGFFPKALPRTPEEREEKWRREASIELKANNPLAKLKRGWNPETVDMGYPIGVVPLYDPMSPEGRNVLESIYEQNPRTPRWKINATYNNTFMDAYRKQRDPATHVRTKKGDQKAVLNKLMSHMPAEHRVNVKQRLKTRSPMIQDAGSDVSQGGKVSPWNSAKELGLGNILFRK